MVQETYGDTKLDFSYDDNGNILFISDGTNITTYAYDSANQLTRENNQAAGKTWTWTYDDAGNITAKKEYNYTTSTLGTVLDTIEYAYGNTNWGDMLSSYDGSTVLHYVFSGNLMRDGTWTYAWEHGRELMRMTGSGKTITFEYNADGLRVSKTVDGVVHNYVYSGGKLVQETYGDTKLNFSYDAYGNPYTLTYTKGSNAPVVYHYVLNLQGDVIRLVTDDGITVATYAYDAWGNIIDMDYTYKAVADANPLRYRSYYYDSETGLYYLQSRYYNPKWGRFINADAYASTGQGILGNNMFTYCLNNPIHYTDPFGSCPHDKKFYETGPFAGQFQYNPDCYLCAMHGEFWVYSNGQSYDLTQHERHDFEQMAICTDGSENPYNSNSHQNMTAYSINGQYMDPSLIHYVVAPVGYTGVTNGDLALVIDHQTGNSVYAIIGDRGPKGQFNEVSLSVAWDLGYHWADGSRGPAGEFTILYFPGTNKQWSSVNDLAFYLN